MCISAVQFADAVGGSVVGPDLTVSGASIDSRDIGGGELFVPIVA
jgi:UDP-N-acetylmuramoyl-tripeptide--D-alanyl-D-alanine ligase